MPHQAPKQALQGGGNAAAHRQARQGLSRPAVQAYGIAPPGRVVQRMPGWLDGLLQIAKNNPGASTLVGVGALTALAYWYWNKKPAVKKPQAPKLAQPEPEPPDHRTLQGLATVLKVEPQTLLNLLESGEGDIDINPLFKAYNGVTTVFTGLVPPSLLNDLPEAPQAIVQELFGRINLLPFNYTGLYQSGNLGFTTRKGDCNTLLQMFVMAAQAAGVQDLDTQSDQTPMLVEPRAIHGRAAHGNTEGLGGWFFYDHHWCTFQGAHYDLLFMSQAAPATAHRTQHDQVHNGVKYDVFDDGRVLIHAAQFGLLNAALSPDSVGYVLASVHEARQYIDEHRKM